MLSQRWGVEQLAGSGKTVWFTVAATELDEATEASRQASSPSSASRDPREPHARPGLLQLTGARFVRSDPVRA